MRLAIEPHERLQAGSSFTDSLRWWLLMLMECPACLGFWIGVMAGWRIPWVFPEGAPILAIAFFTCGTNFLLSKWGGLMEGQIDDNSH